MQNALLGKDYLPSFSSIKPEQIVPSIEALIDRARGVVKKMVLEENIDWHWFEALELLDDELDRAWSPVSHLNNVASTPELREAHDECVQLLTQWGTERGQDEALFQAFTKLARRRDGTAEQQEAVKQALLGFKLSGVDLPKAQREEVAKIKQSLAQLSNAFSNNVLDATQSWHHVVESKEQLKGFPEQNIEQAKIEAQRRELDGYVLTLDAPQYIAAMTYLDDRHLRELSHRAFVSRASSVGPHDNKQDNSQIVDEILLLRAQLAKALGYEHYADLSLAKKMANSVDQVLELINQLALKSKPQAEVEFSQLTEFAKELGFDELQPWDIAYVSEKLRQQQYSVSEQELKPYFPTAKAVEGLFAVTGRLFKIEFEADQVERWNDDVEFFWIKRNGERIAGFYFDLYAREGKRGGAWMDTCRHRITDNGKERLPVAYLTCNFAAPTENTPSLLTHNDVTTLFHEFGHGLHHMLTEVSVASVAGINGVAWDAVELPSQLLENWCWEPEVIPMISGHYKTGEPLPKSLLDKLLAAKNFQSAMAMMRQLEFAYFDMSLHCIANDAHVMQTLKDTQDRMTVIPVIDENRFPYSFSHIFAGGYAAGYYSYKWAEVLSADAYSLFEELGVFSSEAAERLFDHILSKGGSAPADQLYRNFRGRDATIDALIRHSGIEVVNV